MRLIPEFISSRVPFTNTENRRQKKFEYRQFTSEKLVANQIITAFLTQSGVHIDFSLALKKERHYQPGPRITKGANAGKIPIPGAGRSGQTVYSVSYLVPITHQDYEAVVEMLGSAGFLT